MAKASGSKHLSKYPDRRGDTNANWRGGFESKCDQCGRRVWVKPSAAHRATRFCSKPCHSQWMSNNNRGEKASGWRGGAESCACRRCGAAFSVSKGEKSRGGGLFCSPECFNIHKRKPPTEARRIRQKIDAHMGGLMWRTLKAGHGKNCRSWKTMVPYTPEQLEARLKRTMPKGYIWLDYLNGHLHIDHKIPRSVFNYTRPEDYDFQRCWALKNLRLLPAKENLQKSAKLSKPFQPTLL